MAIASWRAVPELQSAVGDHGTVSAYLRESNINVMPSCELSVQMNEGVSADELAGVLSGIAPSERFEPCEVNRVRLASRSEVYADSWNDISSAGWAAVAERLTRPGPVSIFLNSDRPALLVTFAEPDLYPDFAAMVRTLIADERLEDSIGPITWRMEWKASVGQYNEVRIDTEETPPPALADFLGSVAPVMERSTVSIAIVYVIKDGTARTRVELSEPNDEIVAEIMAAFTSSGLGGEMRFTAPESTSSEG